jgi:hypothetical protein
MKKYIVVTWQMVGHLYVKKFDESKEYVLFLELIISLTKGNHAFTVSYLLEESK